MHVHKSGLLLAALSVSSLLNAVDSFTSPLPLILNRHRAARWTSCSASSAPKVALTRELGKNDKLAKLLHEKGYETSEVPCIAFEEGEDAKALPDALKQPWEWVVVTSPEAADVFLTGWNAAGETACSINRHSRNHYFTTTATTATLPVEKGGSQRKERREREREREREHQRQKGSKGKG